MKRRNRLLISMLLAASVGINSCDKFLNPPLKGVYSIDQLGNKKGVNGMLVNAYSTLDGPEGAIYGGASNWVWGSITGGDAYKGTEVTDGVDILPIMKFQLTPTNPYILVKWQACYDGIGQANAVLSMLPNVKDMTADELKQAEAEAKFLRAHHHFEAVKMWDKVPFVDEKETGFKLPNTAAIWDKIEADFKFAYDNLAEVKAFRGQANKWAAAAFLAKTYMFEKKYAEAKTLFTTIIANGKNAQGVKYALMPNYQDNFRITKENNEETIFSIQFSYGDGSTTNANFDNILNYPHGNGIMPGGCCGFFQPSQSLVNSYKTDANGLPGVDNFNTSDVKNDLGLLSSTAFTPYLAGNLDPRLDWTVGRRGVPYHDWGTHPGGDWIRKWEHGGPYSPKKNTYFTSENGITAGKVGWGFSANALNYTIMRFADVLLMAAEAEVEAGSLETARGYVNQVRFRGGAFAPSSTSPFYVAATSPSVTWAKYKVGLYSAPFANQAAARKAVRFERKLEFGMEGHRFFDLVRWGEASTELNDYLSKEASRVKDGTLVGTKFVAGTHERFPIPASVIAASTKDGKSTLTQNTGY